MIPAVLKKKIAGAALLAALFLACAPPLSFAQEPAGEEAVFFQSLDDIPLMPGLREEGDASVIFDKPEGRIAEAAARAETPVGADAVRAFYEDALPQLGWEKAGNGRFVRQGERLSMTVDPGAEGRPTVRFTIEPR